MEYCGDIEGKLGEGFTPDKPELTTLADHWIVQELTRSRESIERALNSYRFAEAGESVYHVVWDSVADWYIEAAKNEDNPQLLAWVLDTCLKLAHPFAPFVTETIWQTLSWHDGLLINERWPSEIAYDEIAAAEFERVQSLVSEIRFVTTGLPGNDKYGLLYQNDSLIEENADIIKQLTRLVSVTHVDQARGLRLAASGREAWLDVTEKTLTDHRLNLEERLASTHREIDVLTQRLRNKGYTDKAPESLVEESRRQLAEKEELVVRLQRELEVLN